jgi:putative tryptophan/tyrosine transport system substrate-binding protein
MRRREFIGAVGAAALAVPTISVARAEQSKKAQRIAIVLSSFPVSKMTETSGDPFFQELFNELRRLGYVEGDNLLIERYSGEGRAAYYPDLARDVVRRNPDVIISCSNEITLDFKAATTTIPIVSVFGSPVEIGIVQSLARPGGNITGVAVDIEADEQWGKRIQLLRQVVPHLTKLAVLDTRRMRDIWEAFIPNFIRRWAVTYVGPPLNHPVNEAEYRRVFASLVQGGAEGILVSEEDENITNQKVIVELAEKNRLPVIYPFQEFVEAGGLMSYGVSEAELGHNAAVMVGQILKGAKPADIPIFLPTKFELAINLKTAKALGLTVPPELLVIADEVIE